MKKFNTFLNSLKNKYNTSIIDSIQNGFKLIFESHEHDAILDIMNKFDIPWEEAQSRYKKQKEKMEQNKEQQQEDTAEELRIKETKDSSQEERLAQLLGDIPD